jgi:hypothetical protein
VPPAAPTAPTDSLSRALDEAIAGRRTALLDLLARGSRLPGTHANEALADAFAAACLARGPAADKVALALTRLSADEAPGATPLEFLPVCGVFTLGARAMADPSVRTAFVAELHAHADDLRFRVRDAVIAALARVGSASGDALVAEVAPWMDGYFHAAAVLSALAVDSWLTTLHDAAAVVARMDEAFTLAQDAPRAAARYPGRKALIDALAKTPAAAAARFGVPVFDMLVRWAPTRDPDLAAALEALMASRKLAGRFRPEVERVRQAVIAGTPAPRNPDHDVGPTRDRSGGRKRRGR